MDIFNWYRRPEPFVNMNDGPEITEQTYLSPRDQIERLMRAGTRLALYRAEQFDFPDGKDTGESDPTRDVGYDMADAHMTLQDLAEAAPVEAPPEGPEAPDAPAESVAPAEAPAEAE